MGRGQETTIRSTEAVHGDAYEAWDQRGASQSINMCRSMHSMPDAQYHLVTQAEAVWKRVHQACVKTAMAQAHKLHAQAPR
jgi:hypothetical protein